MKTLNICAPAPIALALALFLASAGLPGAAQAQPEDVRFRVPRPSEIDLQGRRTLLAAPFLLPGEDGEPSYAQDLELQKELKRFIRRVLQRESELELVPAPPLDYPTRDPDALAHERDFWQAVGRRTGADLILFGSLDLDMLRRSGYQEQDYVGPDGRLARRQVLVEQTGVAADIVLYVLDGRSGELLYKESFKTFAPAGDDVERGTHLEAGLMRPKDLFRRLTGLEERLASLFAEHSRETERTLYGG